MAYTSCSVFTSRSLENKILFFWICFVKLTCVLVIAVRTVSAAAFTAITALQVVFFCKYNIALRTVIEIFGVKLLFKHKCNRENIIPGVLWYNQSTWFPAPLASRF